MARIAQEQIERLKNEVSLERLAQAAKIELVRHGADLIGRCPFHDDKTPSLVISPKKNLWHCLGACQMGGSVIDWVMKAQGVSFRHAVELLHEEHPSLLSIAPGTGQSKQSTVRKLDAPVSADADDRALMGDVVNFYHEALRQAPEALAYLKKRGLDSAEMIDQFKLGFANRTLGYRLPLKNRNAGEEIRSRLQKLGVMRHSGHEHFNGSIVIPIFSEDGAVSEMYGRKINDNLRAGTATHLYLPGPHHGVWNWQALRVSKEIIVCEALIDALTFWCAGFRNVTASYGVEGFTPDHLTALKQHATERVLIAYDRDEAGDKAAVALAQKLMVEGIECFRVEFPKGMDANAYALKVQPAAKSLSLALRRASWMGKGAAPRRELEAQLVVHEQLDAPPAPFLAANSPREMKAEVVHEQSASPVPAAPLEPQVALERRGEEIILTLGERRYRIRGFGKNATMDALKVNVLCSRGDAFYVDTLDLYQARQRAAFIKQAALEVGSGEETIKSDLGKILLKLEALQEAAIAAELEPKDKPLILNAAEEHAALELLRDANLLERILSDFTRAGLVGEETNKLVAYLAAVSRKLEQPLAVIIQSTSAAGKSSLMDAVLALMPKEETVKYSAMTGQSLFYMGETNLKHKILAIVEEEGAERAAYALKLLQSEGELTIASTGKDPETGRHITHEYRVEGPVMIFLTTTAIEIDEELLNRCLVLTVDEEREQTRAIHDAQRKAQTLSGLLSRRDRQAIVKLHQNAQRLLKPMLVANPFAEKLTFIDHQTRTRRDHGKYLTLIRTIALLHQYQREAKTVVHRGEAVSYIEVSAGDISVANRLCHEVLGRTLDELPPQTRRLLLLLDAMVSKACADKQIPRRDFHFSRKEARAHAGWSLTQMRIHLERLVEHEFVLVHRGSRGQSFVYELCFNAKTDVSGGRVLPGLIAPGAIATRTAPSWRGEDAKLAGAWRPEDGDKAGGWQSRKSPPKPHGDAALCNVPTSSAKNTSPVPASENRIAIVSSRVLA